MTSGNRVVVECCNELVSGDAIEAFYEDTVIYRGPVTDMIPECGLFWILDTLTGCTRLLDMADLEIVRISPPTLKRRHRRFLRDGRRHADGRGTPSSYWREVSALG